MLRDRRTSPIYRFWWTRERVLEGLRRLHAETGQAPNCTGRGYQRLMRECGQQGLRGARRRYPAESAVLRYWPTLAQAWSAAGITPDGRRVSATSPDGSGAGWAWGHQAGERHGRLTVVEFAGYRQGKRARVALWRCRCDCGREYIVRAGDFGHRRECDQCGRERGRARLRARAEAACRAAAGVQTAATTSLAGAVGAPRETSPGWASAGGGPESMPALFSSLQERV